MMIIKMKIEYKIDYKEYEDILKTSGLVLWNTISSNIVDGFRIFPDDNMMRTINGESFVCVKKAGEVFLYISRKEFSKAVERYFRLNIFNSSNIIKIVQDFNSESELNGDLFWDFHLFLTSEECGAKIIPLA
jgi:hypothetical protein